jgi:hypothetical protein
VNQLHDASPGVPPEPSADEWAVHVRDALRAEADAARRLRELAERQGAFVAEGRIATASALLAHRRTLIGQMRECEAVVREIAARGITVGSLPEPVAEELRGLQQAIRADLRVVAERDAVDSAAIRERRDAAGRELGRINGGRRATRAYAGVPGGGPAPRFGDERA